MSLPILTPEQRADALAKAAESRQVRAVALGALRSGQVTLTDVLADPASPLRKAPVRTVLLALPGAGPVTVAKAMESAGIAANRRVRGLGAQQCESLREYFPA